MKLRDLDDTALPAAAGYLNRVVNSVAGRWGAVRSRASRSTRSDRPWFTGRVGRAIAAVVVVGALVGIGVAALVNGGSNPSKPRLGNGTLVGPRVGQRVSAYTSAANKELQQLMVHGNKPVYALVDFNSYQTVSQAARVLAHYTVVRAFFQPPSHSRLASSNSVSIRTTFARDVAGAMQAVVVERRREAAAYATYLRNTRVSGDAGKRLKQFYSTEQRAAAAEVRALTPNCRCVFAAVVHGPPSQIATLFVSSTAVRVVDSAPQGVPLQQVVFVPLPPEVRGVVPLLLQPYPAPGYA